MLNRRGDLTAIAIDPRQNARRSVLRKLGLVDLVSTDTLNISATHDALVTRQSSLEHFRIDGLEIEAPAGVYHPTPDSSSEFFLRNIKAMDKTKITKTLEIGAGTGVISLYIAANFRARAVAVDISQVAVEATRRNAERNGVKLECLRSDMFSEVREKDFDLIIFNAPLIDKRPENDVERFSLCDPGGRITEAYLRGAREHVSRSGLIIVSICTNSAYEVLDDIDLRYEIVGFELSYSGFWRAILGARR